MRQATSVSDSVESYVLRVNSYGIQKDRDAWVHKGLVARNVVEGGMTELTEPSDSE